jgi:hypothetical protein
MRSTLLKSTDTITTALWDFIKNKLKLFNMRKHKHSIESTNTFIYSQLFYKIN